jgi:pimeloyl-ACP methyl ester carboxylesterase
MNPTLHAVRLPSGLTLEVAIQGRRGPLPLLMLHGITDSWHSFDVLLPFIGPEWQVVVPSQRGHGGSDKPAQGYRTSDFVADLEALIETLELPPVLVVGHSMGSTHALRLAIDRPDLVRGVVGLGTFASYADKADLLQFDTEVIRPLVDPVPHALAHDFQASTLARPTAPGLLERMTGESLKVPAHVWRDAFAGLFEDDFSDRLHRVGVPALLLAGGADAMVPASDLERLRAALPDAQGETWAGAGHALHWEEPARCAARVLEFARALLADERRGVAAVA